MAAVREVAKRAWQMGPTWTDAVALAGVGVLLIWRWGIPWPAAIVICVLACVAIFGILGWLDLHNEAADAEQLADAPPHEGEAT